MKKNILLTFSLVLALLGGLIFVSSCDLIEDSGIELSNEEVIEGLKNALQVGTDTAVSQANKAGGFLNNEIIKIVLPDEANKLLDFTNTIGNNPNIPLLLQPIVNPLLDQIAGPAITNLTDNLLTQMNTAAENASEKATPIFVEAITGITIGDGFEILNGDNKAATSYLETNTTSSLSTAFKPDIQNALEAINAQQTWENLGEKYNMAVQVLDFVPELYPNGLEPINTDLAGHTTDKALGGLFHLVGEEEKQIREDPVARVTSILQKVFGN